VVPYRGGRIAGGIAEELVQRGLSPEGADTAVLGLVETWLQRALLRPVPLPAGSRRR
jgi:hypothetical protein